MSDLDELFKQLAQAKSQDPLYQKNKKIEDQVKESVKADFGSLLSQISAAKAEDPVYQKHKKIEDQVKESVKSDLGSLFSELASLKKQKTVMVEQHPELAQEPIETPVEFEPQLVEEVLTEVSPLPTPVGVVPPEAQVPDINKYLNTQAKVEEPNTYTKEFKNVNDKIKFLEQWISKIQNAGPGSGEVNLRYLDDVDRSTIGDGKYLNYNATTKKFQFSTLSGGGAPQVQSDWTEADTTEPSFIKNKPSLFSGDYDDLINKPTIPDAQIQSDWNQTNNAALDYIKNKPSIPDVSHIDDLLAATGEPMGHEDKSQSTISFNANTRVFTIAPTGSEFHVWVKGTKYTYTTAQTVTLPNTSGLYYIYFDENGIGYQTSFYTWDSQAMTAYVYFNAVSTRGYLFDERHGITLDWQTHEFLHRTHGALYSSGFAASNYSLMGDGSSNAHCTLDLSGGTFFDEDNQIDIVHSNTPVANTFQQDLVGPAQIPIFYKEANGLWKLDTATDYPMKLGTDRPQYNRNNGNGTWSTVDVDNNKFGVTFIVATNMVNTPIIGILGQSARDNVGAAESYNLSDLDLTGFPIVEMRQLYRVCYECKTSYTNTPSARITSIWDLRVTTTASTNVTTGDHGSLTGLADDDHPQYLLRTDAPTALSEFTNDITTVTWSNPSPSPSTIWKTSFSANSTNATITFNEGLPGLGSIYTWAFDTTKLTFPDSTQQTTAWTGTYSYNNLTDKPTIPSLTGYATETYVNTAITNVVGAAPEALNTLKEIADQLATDESAVSSLTTAVAGKVSLTGSYANPSWITSLAYSKLTGAPTIPTVPTNVSSFTNDSGYLTSVSWSQVTSKPENILTLNDTNVVSNDMLVNKSITIGDVTVTLGQVITALTGLTSVSVSGTGINVGAKLTMFDDGNAHIHTTAGNLWLNAGTNSNVSINTQTGGNVELGNTTSMNCGYGSVAPVYGVRAWISCGYVNGNMVTNGSGNLSVTRTAAGKYNFTFTDRNMPDGNYCVTATAKTPNDNSDVTANVGYNTSTTATGFTIHTARYGDGFKDVPQLFVQVVR